MSASPNSPTPQKVVLITGASSGIGQACAEHLGRNGWRVFATRRGAPSTTLAEAPFEMLQMDVDDENAVRQCVESLLARTGRLDAVVNNAGIAIMGAVEDTSIEEA